MLEKIPGTTNFAREPKKFRGQCIAPEGPLVALGLSAARNNWLTAACYKWVADENTLPVILLLRVKE